MNISYTSDNMMDRFFTQIYALRTLIINTINKNKMNWITQMLSDQILKSHSHHLRTLE